LDKILVTGGAGFIGSHFLEFILKRTSTEIIVIDNLSYSSNLMNIPDNKQIEFIWSDIVNEEHINYIFKKHKPNKVFHFAAESHVDNAIKNYRPFLETNVIGTINLLNASLSVEVDKFHFISTDEVYGSLDYDDINLFKETTQIDPKNPYSASKAAAEHYVKAWNNTYDLPYLITCSSNNYGIRQYHEKLIPKVVMHALNEKRIVMYGGGEQTRDWLYVEDHCNAIWTLEEQGIINEKYNIGGNCEIQNIKLTEKILGYMNKSSSLIDKSYEDSIINYCRPGQDSRYATDNSKITKRTNWKPNANLDEELEYIINWYKRKFQNFSITDY
tara:strand:+ start:284 stop:1270 length:987 start_codon:yes stop_codon:yes gene_type:complete